MIKKHLPQNDAERIEALKSVMFHVSVQSSESLPFSSENVRYVQPFMKKLEASMTGETINNQSINPEILRRLVDELILDIWEEVECKFYAMDTNQMIQKATEFGVRYLPQLGNSYRLSA